MTADKITHLAEELLASLQEDISRCVTREEHIRVSARANHAHLLLQGLNQMFHAGAEDDDLSQEDTSNGDA